MPVSCSKMDFKKYFTSFGLLIKVNKTWKNCFRENVSPSVGEGKMQVYHFGHLIVCFMCGSSCAEKYFKVTILQTLVGLRVILTLYSKSI